MLRDSLYSRLSDDAGVSAIVSNRIYPVVIPQQSYDEATKQPCLVYSIDTDARGITFEGTDSLVRCRLTIDCYATNPDTPHTLAEAVRDCLVDFEGTVAASTSPISSVRIKRIFMDGEVEQHDEEPGLYHVMQRYLVWYVE